MCRSSKKSPAYQISIFADMVGFSGYDDVKGAELAQKHNRIVKCWFAKIKVRQRRSDGDGLFLLLREGDVGFKKGFNENFLKEFFRTVRMIHRCCARAGIRSKMGISYGKVRRLGGDIYGESINTAARLCSLARANQVLFCESFFRLLELVSPERQPLTICNSCYNECTELIFYPYRIIRYIDIPLKNMGEITVYEFVHTKQSMGAPGRSAFAEQVFEVTTECVQKYPFLRMFEGMHFAYIDNGRPFDHQKTNIKTIAFYLSGLGLDYEDYAKMLETTEVRAIAFNLLGFGHNELNTTTYARFLNVSLNDFINLIQFFLVETIKCIWQAEKKKDNGYTGINLVFEGFSFGATFALLWAANLHRLRPMLPKSVAKIGLVLKDPNTCGYGFISSQFANTALADASNVNYVASRLGVHSAHCNDLGVSQAVQWKVQVDFANYFMRITQKFAEQGSFVPVVHVAQLVLKYFSLRTPTDFDYFGKRDDHEREAEFKRLTQLLQHAHGHNVDILLTFDGDADGMLSAAWAEAFKHRENLTHLSVYSNTTLSHFDLIKLVQIKLFQDELMRLLQCENQMCRNKKHMKS